MLKFQTFSLYVGDLHADVTELDLFRIFCRAGSVCSIRVCKDKITGRSLNYAYVNFRYHEEAQKAIDKLNFHVIHGSPIRIMWSQRNPGRRKSGIGNLFVKNLHFSINSKDLFDVFSVYGDILSCKLVTKGTLSKGYGYVQFKEIISAKMAASYLNGGIWNGQKVVVEPFEKRASKQNGFAADYSSVIVKENETQHLLDTQLDWIDVEPIKPEIIHHGNDCISSSTFSASGLSSSFPYYCRNDSISNSKIVHDFMNSSNLDPTPVLQPTDYTYSSVQGLNCDRFCQFFVLLPVILKNIYIGCISIVAPLNFGALFGSFFIE